MVAVWLLSAFLVVLIAVVLRFVYPLDLFLSLELHLYLFLSIFPIGRVS